MHAHWILRSQGRNSIVFKMEETHVICSVPLIPQQGELRPKEEMSLPQGGSETKMMRVKPEPWPRLESGSPALQLRVLSDTKLPSAVVLLRILSLETRSLISPSPSAVGPLGTSFPDVLSQPTLSLPPFQG